MLALYFDYVVLPAAVAVLRVDALVTGTGARVHMRGVDVVPLQHAVATTPDQLDGLSSHADHAAAAGLHARRPSRRPPTFNAHLLGEEAERRGVGAPWRAAALRAYWERDADLNDSAVLTELAETVGIAPSVVSSLLADDRRRSALRARITADRRRGIGGVPVIELDGALVDADLDDDELAALLALTEPERTT